MPLDEIANLNVGIERIPLFSGLSHPQIEKLLAFCQSKRVVAGGPVRAAPGGEMLS